MSSNYPLGVEYDPKAPWNEEEQPDREIEVTVSITLSKTMKVNVDDYISFGIDEDGYPDIDYSMCDLKWAVESQKVLPQDAYKHITDSKKSDLEGWNVDDFEVVME